MMSLMPPKLPTFRPSLSLNEARLKSRVLKALGSLLRVDPQLSVSRGLLLMNAHIKLHLSYLRVSVVTVLQLMDFSDFF